MPRSTLLQVFRVRSFLFLWLAEIFSQIAMNMANFILIIVAFKLSSSNAVVSGIVLSFTIPAILFGALAGVFVDRWDKRTVLIMTNILRMLLVFTLAFFHTNLFVLFLFSFLVALVTQFFIPAETPMIPLLVKKDQLLAANAYFGLGIYGSIVIAYALSGPFLLFFGDTYAFVGLAGFFLMAAVFAGLIKPKYPVNLEKKDATISSGLMHEIKDALRLIAKTKEIFHSLLLLTLSQVLVLILAVIGPGYASQVLNIQVDVFPLLFVTPAALGMVVGAFLLIKYLNTKSREKSATIGVLLSGMAILLLPYGSKVASRDIVQTINTYLPPVIQIDILHIMVLLAFILGFANALVFVPSNTILQEKTSDNFRGKMYGILNAFIGIFSLLPIILVGEFADLFGVAAVIVGIGVAILALGILRLILQTQKKI